MSILLRTVHGSHLYGLSKPGSDLDYYVVVDGKNKKVNKQTIVNGVDTNVVCLDTFLSLCQKGVPQALEALYSPYATVDGIPYIRHTFYAHGSVVESTYRRTIKNFWDDRRGMDTFKVRRHALRLMLNLKDIREYGKIYPVLSIEQISLISGLALRENGREILERKLYG